MLTKHGVFVLQGDSITDTRHYIDPEFLGTGYARMIAKYIDNFYPDLEMKVYNRGNGGDRAINLVNRWDEDCLDLRPTVVSMLIGINDVWRKFDRDDPTTWEDYAERCEYLMESVKDTGASLIVLEPFAIPTGVVTDEWREDLDPKIFALRKLAYKYADAYIPLDGIFWKLSIEADPTVWSEDGVHPTAAGHRIIANEIIKVLEGK